MTLAGRRGGARAAAWRARTSPASPWRARLPDAGRTSVRRALGANRWQRLRVALVENLLIGASAAPRVGCAARRWAIPVIRAWLPDDFPRAHEVAFTGAQRGLRLTVALVAVLMATVLAAGPRRSVAAIGRVTTGPPDAAATDLAGRRPRSRWRASCAPARSSCGGIYRAAGGAGPRLPGRGRADVPRHRSRAGRAGSRGAVGTRLERSAPGDLDIDGRRAVGRDDQPAVERLRRERRYPMVGRSRCADDVDTGVRYQAATDGFFEAARVRLS